MADLESLLDRLLTHSVDFVIIGGFAAMAHGSSLLTQDLDICLPFEKSNLGKLAAAIQDLDPRHRMAPSRPLVNLVPKELATYHNLYLDTKFGQLDCLSQVEGLGIYKVVFQKSVPISLKGGTCRILSLDALIESKEALGRDRDREAALQLRAIREKRSEAP